MTSGFGALFASKTVEKAKKIVKHIQIAQQNNVKKLQKAYVV